MPRQTNIADVLYRTKRYGKWIQEVVNIPESKTELEDALKYCSHILTTKLTPEQKANGQKIREVKILNRHELEL